MSTAERANEQCRRLLNEEFHGLHKSPIIVRVGNLEGCDGKGMWLERGSQGMCAAWGGGGLMEDVHLKDREGHRR
jgi:hypothetical protein